MAERRAEVIEGSIQELVCETGLDLTGWTNLDLHFRKPDETTEVIRTSASDGVDDGSLPLEGKVYYTPSTSEWGSDVGEWKVVVRIRKAGVDVYTKPPALVTVVPKFQN